MFGEEVVTGTKFAEMLRKTFAVRLFIGGTDTW
jgi:hypothetical protein